MRLQETLQSEVAFFGMDAPCVRALAAAGTGAAAHLPTSPQAGPAVVASQLEMQVSLKPMHSFQDLVAIVQAQRTSGLTVVSKRRITGNVPAVSRATHRPALGPITAAESATAVGRGGPPGRSYTL